MAIAQFGYAINLILTFATASLGFLLAIVKENDFQPGCGGKIVCLCSISCLGLSILLGLSSVMTRLYDFRKTKDIIKERRGQNRAAVITNLEQCSDALGLWTWRLFRLQVVMFGVGIISLIATFATVYHTIVAVTPN